jgi:hypothetical protein
MVDFQTGHFALKACADVSKRFAGALDTKQKENVTKRPVNQTIYLAMRIITVGFCYVDSYS